MVNPATGKPTDYEEMWEDREPLTTSPDDDLRRKCVVLQLHDDGHEARGMVMRVGQFCQGLLRVGESLSLERWVWKEDGGWKREVRIGSLWLPCGVMLEGERLRLGGEVKHGDFVWKVLELSEF